MARTIGNPLSWAAQALGIAGRVVGENTAALGGEGATVEPEVREITTDDLREALRLGAADFAAFRSDVLFLCLVYPAAGLVLVWFTYRSDLIPLIFPLISGFALIGPLAAVGLYEMSRRRERGQATGWGDAFAFLGTPAFGPVFALGAYLLALFVAWMVVAHWIWRLTLGPEPPASVGQFLGDVLLTPAGWAMIIVGVGVGFVFAAVVLAMSLVSFPLLIDRHVSLPVAVVTSLKVAQKSPRTVAIWGALVAAGLVIGAIPLLIGLIFVLPLFGHATWHLYRRAVTPLPE